MPAGLRSSRHLLYTRRWARVRAIVRRRDGWKCVLCGHRGRLEVDHIIPRYLRPDLMFDPNALQLLCRSCHFFKSAKENRERRERAHGAKTLTPSNIAWNLAVSELMDC